MGNHITKSYDINNSALESGAAKNKHINLRNRAFKRFSFNKKTKHRMKDKPELLKSKLCVIANDSCPININRYSSGNYDTLNEFADISHNQETIPNCHCPTNVAVKEEDSLRALNSSNCSPDDVANNNSCILKSDLSIGQNQSANLSRTNQRLSETSLNSDDLMLSTDVNLDQADDDVSKDYNASEKDDPFISALTHTNQEIEKDGLVQMCAEDSEKNDIVYFDSSRESSASLQRKLGYRVNTRRPHSFSTPLRSEIKSKARRSSNLNTVESVDLAWTWMSASESANVAQEIANLKLMLLKTKRLLLDDFNNDSFCNGSIFTENDTNVFSEPSTPIYYNESQKLLNIDPNIQQSKDWTNMDKDGLLQALQDMSERNYSLHCQLNDKNRVIELLQDNKRRFQRPHARTDPVVCRISRSSTFDSSAMTMQLSPTPDYMNINNTFSDDSKNLKPEMKNIDSGLYQSSSSTDSNLYQN